MVPKISPRPSFPYGPAALWASGQRGVIPPFVKEPVLSLSKERSGGIYGACRDNYGTINSHNLPQSGRLEIVNRSKRIEYREPPEGG